MFIIKSFAATPVVVGSSRVVVVAIQIPVGKSIPAGKGQLAADSAGIGIVK